MGFDAEIGIVVKGAKDAISTLEDLRGVSAELDKQIDKMQRSLAGAVSGIEKVSGAAASGVTGVKAQTTALQGLIREYNGLQRAAVSAGKTQGSVGSAAALGTQKVKELEAARLEQKRFNDYVSQSNARVNALELREVQNTQKAVRAERAESAKQAVRVAKEQQNAAFASYSGNMPNALKAAQTAAMDSYASNIAYTRSNEALNSSLSNTRYALYDVASTMAVVSAATLGVVAATETVAIGFERDFAQVERTSGATGTSLQSLRDDLVGISTTLPVAFSDVTAIATLGSQLGVAQSQLNGFTQTVAQFSSTTNTSFDAAATGLGRLVQLTDQQGAFDQYASAIYQVGVNSVSTEAEILAVANQIAVSGNLAGFSADQIIGLSGALASLGVQPEAARGSIMRVFDNITTAAAEGGDALQQFANISGMSAEQFATSWESDPQQAFSAFIGGMSKAADNGADLSTVLDDLGLVAVRDQQALKLLADNTEVYSRALEDSANAYKDGTALAEGYGVIAETTAARLQVLANTLMAIADSAADLGPIKAVVGLLQGLADAIMLVVDSPIGGTLATVVLSIGALVGVLAGAAAANALMTASAYALRQANLAMSDGMTRAGSGVTLLAREMTVLALGTQRATAANTAFSASLAAGTGRLAATAAGARAATGSMLSLGGALRGLVSSTGIGLAFMGAGAIINSLAEANRQYKTTVDEVTASLDRQTGAFTENTTTAIANNLQKSGALDAAQRLGLGLDVVTQAAMGNKAAMQQVQAAFAQVDAANAAAARNQELYTKELVRNEDAANLLRRQLGSVSDAVTEGKNAFEQVQEAIGATADVTASAGGEIEDFGAKLTDLVDNAYNLTGGTVAIQNALASLGESLAVNGNDFSAYSESGRLNLVALQAVVSAMAQASGGDAAVLATHIAGLMQSLGQFGVNAASDLIYLQNILNGLTGGKGTAGLPGVTQAATAASNGLGQGFSRGATKAAGAAKKAGKAAKDTAKEIRTLSDYAKDLGSVFKDAFELRFNLDNSRDAVSEAYQQIIDSAKDAADAAQDAAEAFEDAQARINSLNTDNRVLEYQLSVANEYKDSLRAAEIIAEMGENNKDLAEAQNDRADSQEELRKAQEKSSRTLVGDSQVARDNRSTVQNLVEAYQDQVAALANTGLSSQQLQAETARLKAQFVAQLTQMGFNRAEVDRYAVAFDGLGRIIANMPRNVTVSANVDPAQRAIEEFLARNSNRSVGVNANLAGASGNLGSFNAGIIGANQLNVAQEIYAPRMRVGASGTPVQGMYAVASTGGIVPSYLASGGVTGLHPGAPQGTDTIPAWLSPGEAVTRSAAVDYYGVPFMNAINNMQVPKYLATGTGAASGSRGPAIQLVELLPNQLQAIIEGVSTQVSLDGKVIAAAVSTNHANQAQRGSN